MKTGRRAEKIGDHKRYQVCSETVQKSVEEEPGRSVEERPRGDVGAGESRRRNACKNQEEEEEQEEKLVARSSISVSALITGRHFITII